MRKHIWCSAVACFCLALATPALAQSPADSLRDLLQRLEQNQGRQTAEQIEREEAFRNARNRQRALLAQAQAQLRQAEADAARLEQAFKDNERQLAELEALLQERLGVYGEVFGVMRQLARRVHDVLHQSLSAYGAQADIALLDMLATSRDLPSEAQLDALWLAMQREMTAQSEVTRFTAPLQDASGQAQMASLIRFGPFVVVDGARFLRRTDTDAFVPLSRQPPARFRAALGRYFDAPADTLAPAVIDPTRGALLALYVRTPDLLARLAQGGLVGYVILLLGILGMGLASQRVWWLGRQYRALKRELASKDFAHSTSPLGRIWQAYQKYKTRAGQDIEHQLDMILVQEQPALERGLSLLKLLAGIAPLLGLLGTVTGMILTFQAISLLGSGDPKLMAGGISQALVTTVLGLCVAIPLLLLHNLAHTRARAIMQVLEEQALGLIANHTDADGTKRQTR